MTAAAFIATIGVNSHVSTGANGYSSIPNVIADMSYLGVTADRDGDNGDFSSLQSMANAGIKFDFLFAGGGAFNAAATLSTLFRPEASMRSKARTRSTTSQSRTTVLGDCRERSTSRLRSTRWRTPMPHCLA
jgi:hypothetical protein